MNKSTLIELWQDHGEHIVAVDGCLRQFNGEQAGLTGFPAFQMPRRQEAMFSEQRIPG
ncbi:hypothetical protein G6M78_12745 [Agrobacterium tumefaciens]|uniref:hypothetical protein n=1 Tax=Agrobacterium tumefaciens TaxID=358 RepID=UPI0015730FA8|nr:hypothetical protein [Agrobacterium tumefaciens]NTE55938.1 hypothetical protein [Agrobacterium tumefaciens]NTE74351.1 hypothetical protein [Agrobacterium tumefaciens]